MSSPIFYRLNSVAVLDVTGADAGMIIHNLTTNEVKSLEVGEGRETFITDVRGKMLGHVCLFREQDSLRMIGPAGQTERLAQHVDRYTIREDATPVIRDEEFVALVLPSEAAAAIGISTQLGEQPSKSTCRIGDTEVSAYSTRWLGEGTVVLLVPRVDENRICETLESQSFTSAGEAEFHRARTIAGFPWYGIDLDDSNLPQEADRDSLAVSFTKGCYLGQETVARLDALGQVQKKLVRWSISGDLPNVNAKLVSEEKTVGRLTSVAADRDGGVSAIGFARRSHFDPGATATGINESTGSEFIGTVV
jgi:folate-binding protein YgfZ